MDTKMTAMWTPDIRLQTAEELYAQLCEAQKDICKRECGAWHSKLCDEINAVLLNAEPILQHWSEE